MSFLVIIQTTLQMKQVMVILEHLFLVNVYHFSSEHPRFFDKKYQFGSLPPNVKGGESEPKIRICLI